MKLTIKQENEYPLYFKNLVKIKYYDTNKEFFVLTNDGDSIVIEVNDGFEIEIE